MTLVPKKKTIRELVYYFILLALIFSWPLWGIYKACIAQEGCWGVTLGDSLTVGSGDERGRGGYVALLADKLKSLKNPVCLKNLAESGWTCRQIVEQPRRGKQKTMLAEALDKKPDLVILWIGVNDVTNWTWVEPKGAGNFDEVEFQNFYRTILSSWKSNNKTKILVGTLLDLNRAPVSRLWHQDKQALIARRIQQANQIIREEAKIAGTQVVDFFGCEALYRPENWSPDGFHPNHKGYQVIAERWWEGLRPVLEKK